MMVENKQSGEATLAYPEHLITPEDYLKFIELDEFEDDWDSLGFDLEDDIWSLFVAIMINPEGGEVVPGTGGLRKLRFSPQRSNSGKRGAVRVCYVYLKEHFTVLLVLAYPKSEKLDLSSVDKKGISKYIASAKRNLSKKQ